MLVGVAALGLAFYFSRAGELATLNWMIGALLPYAASACFLPLSMNPVLSTQLGTRHRAGIGVTEETDAIAVIVSEETGAISLAVAAKIERDLTVEQVRERLGELLRRYVPPSTLPTPITNGSEGLEAADEETPRSSFSRTVDSRTNPGAGR